MGSFAPVALCMRERVFGEAFGKCESSRHVAVQQIRPPFTSERVLPFVCVLLTRNATHNFYSVTL